MNANIQDVFESNTQKQVEDLNAGWRNSISKLMGLNPDTFQLAQGTLGLQTSDNYGLFLIADAIPPNSAIGYYDSSTMNSRADAYGVYLNALLPESNPNAVRDALGNYYTSWVNWQKANKPAKGDTLMSRFEQWALEEAIDAGTVARGKSAILSVQNSALVRAQEAYYSADKQSFIPPGQSEVNLFPYTATTDAATQAINSGASLENISFDSNSMDTSVSKTFVDGSASGFYDIFYGSAEGSFSSLNTKAASAKITISGRVGKYATLSSGPGVWYSSGEVQRGFNANGDNSVWDPNSSAGNWESFFATPQGSLSRYISQLVLVSDYEITVTSHASYSQEDYKQIKTKATFGVWPFFSTSVSTSHTTDYKLNSDSSLSVTFTLPKGAIQIWGVNVIEQD